MEMDNLSILIIRWLFVMVAMLLTISAAGSMALVAINTWGVQCVSSAGLSS
jgi:hypothetical protein